MFRFVLLLITTILSATTANAQSNYKHFGSRPLLFLVPSTPGGFSDAVARIVADGISTHLGQPVRVENRPGGYVTVAAQYMLEQPPDGHTFMVSANAITATRRFNSEMAIRPLEQLSVASMTVRSPMVMVIPNTIQVQDARQLISLIRSSPDRFTYASVGGGGIPTMSAETLSRALNIQMVNVAYRGMSMAQPDLQAGRISSMFVEVPHAVQLVQAGNRAILIGSDIRDPKLPNTETWREAGINSTFYSWQSIWVSSTTPREIRTELNAIIAASLRSGSAREKLIALGIPPHDIYDTTLEIHENTVRDEASRWN